MAENKVKNFVEIFAKEITVEVAKKIGKLLTSSKRKLQITCILNKEAAEEINVKCIWPKAEILSKTFSS